MLPFNLGAVVRLTMTTAPLLGLACMVNFFFRPNPGVMLVRFRVTSTYSPGSSKPPDPMIQVLVQVQ